MTFEQIFSGQLRLSQAILHLRNRAASTVIVQGIFWMPCDETEAVGILEAAYWQLQHEFQHKQLKKLKKRKTAVSA